MTDRSRTASSAVCGLPACGLLSLGGGPARGQSSYVRLAGGPLRPIVLSPDGLGR
jgi:hypothetical protein